MRLLSIALLPATLLVTSCGVNEDNFPEKYAKATCDQMFDCEIQGYDTWEDETACREDIQDVWDDMKQMMDALGCSVDYDLAGDCLKDYRRASCEEIDSPTGFTSSACEDMWICDAWDTGFGF